MLEPCLHGLCGILSHRSTVLLTPLLSVTSTGEDSSWVQGGGGEAVFSICMCMLLLDQLPQPINRNKEITN